MYYITKMERKSGIPKKLCVINLFFYPNTSFWRRSNGL